MNVGNVQLSVITFSRVLFTKQDIKTLLCESRHRMLMNNTKIIIQNHLRLVFYNSTRVFFPGERPYLVVMEV